MLPWPRQVQDVAAACQAVPDWADQSLRFWQILPEALLMLWLIKYLLSGQKLVTAVQRFVEKLSAELQQQLLLKLLLLTS